MGSRPCSALRKQTPVASILVASADFSDLSSSDDSSNDAGSSDFSSDDDTPCAGASNFNKRLQVRLFFDIALCIYKKMHFILDDSAVFFSLGPQQHMARIFAELIAPCQVLANETTRCLCWSSDVERCVSVL